MISFATAFYFLISADPPIKYDIKSRLHPALLKPETLYTLLRHRIIKEIRRRQNYQFRKDHEEGKDDKDNTDWDGNKLLRLTKPYYVPILSLKKYMRQKAGKKYDVMVKRARKIDGMRNQGSSKDPQKIPIFVSVMKINNGAKRNPENESGLSPLGINFKRHRRANNIDKGKLIYRIISTVLLYFFTIIFACTLSCCITRLLSSFY